MGHRNLLATSFLNDFTMRASNPGSSKLSLSQVKIKCGQQFVWLAQRQQTPFNLPVYFPRIFLSGNVQVEAVVG